MLSWVILVVAGLMEVSWAAGLKRVDEPAWLVFTVLALGASVSLLAVAARELPLGVAYAAWVGIGIVGTVTVSVVLYGERLAPSQWGFLGLIVIGILGMKLGHVDEDEAVEPAVASLVPDLLPAES